MARPIYKVVDDLPKRGLTPGLLGALDWGGAGGVHQHHRIRGNDPVRHRIDGRGAYSARRRTGDSPVQRLVSGVSESALAVSNRRSSTQGQAGTLAFVAKIAENIKFLSFLEKLTPKADTTQAVDLGLKLVAEIVAFCSLNGIPGDSVGDFVESLSNYRHEALMRMGALICVDGVLPLGPDFVSKALGMLDKSGASDLAGSERFQRVRGLIPGRVDAGAAGLHAERTGINRRLGRVLCGRTRRDGRKKSPAASKGSPTAGREVWIGSRLRST